MPKGKSNLLRRLAARLTWGQQTVAALVVIVGAAFGADVYVAKNADLKQLAADVYQGQRRTDRRQLRQEETQLQSIPERERRPRTSFEEQRLKEVQEELRDVDRELGQRSGG